jgi:DNA-binding transcriptional regulator YiaG
VQPRELKRIRQRLGVTQKGLAAHVGVTGNTIARWERGEVPIGPVATRLLRTLESSGLNVKADRPRASTRKRS